MRLLGGLAVLTLFAMLVGCGGNNKVVMENYRKNCSVEVVGVSDAAISDGLPEGLNVNNVSKSILNDVVGGLANKGLTKNNNKNMFKVKYTISYFGHKWNGGIKVKYIIGYNIQLIDESTGNVIASEKNDKDDTELLKAIEDVSDNIVNFATDNIK
jgi:TolB-like protein